MPSNSFVEAVNRSETNECFIFLAEINHSDLQEPIYLSSDATILLRYDGSSGNPVYGTIHDEKEWLYAPFSIVLPDSPQDGKQPVADVEIANTSFDVVRALREIRTSADVSLKVVLSSDLENVEYDIPKMKLNTTTTTMTKIQGKLGTTYALDEPCPAVDFTSGTFPALFL